MMRFRAVHQFLPALFRGDAIGNHALSLQQIIKSWGYASEFFTEARHDRTEASAQHYLTYLKYSHRDNLVLYHYGIGGQLTGFALDLPDCIVLYYHNITPAYFFYGYSNHLAFHLDQGRRDLQRLARRMPAIAGSPYNARELEGLGFRVLGVVPYAFALQAQASVNDADSQAVAARYARPGSTDWLYVGRLAPNKRVEDVIKAFYYYHAWINPASRLLLVGSGAGMERYVERLTGLIARLRLQEAVVFTGPVAQPAPFYRMAQVYVSMSEHEGFCVPLLEAMYHGLPIVAYASSAVPETLGGAGVLITRKDYPIIAEAVHEVITNSVLRVQLVAGQRARLAAFSPAQAAADLRACLNAVLGPASN
jgi:glycosyltransferase involved in cell wall biosynthesis